MWCAGRPPSTAGPRASLFRGAADVAVSLQVAIGVAPEASRRRIAGNDRPNAEQVAATAAFARVLVPSSVPLAEGGGDGL